MTANTFESEAQRGTAQPGAREQGTGRIVSLGLNDPPEKDLPSPLDP